MNVLITGASKGIGREFAHVFAREGHDVIAVARTKSDLSSLKKELEEEFEISVTPIVADLAKPDTAKNLFSALKKEQLQIDVLVNNAGFGDWGIFSESDLAKQTDMVAVNVTALTQMAHHFLNQVDAAKDTYLLNMGSIASFFPGPYMSVYFATKAYVLSFSEALSEELKLTNTHVTCVCPGPSESEFAKEANIKSSNFASGIPTAEEVAEFGYNALMAKKVIAIHGTKTKRLANIVRFLPRKWVRDMANERQRPKDA